MTHKVRTTMRPDQEIEVEQSEYDDLAMQGLIVTDGRATIKATEQLAADKAAAAAGAGK